MIRRSLKALSDLPVRRLGNTMARGASLIVTDRRWGATLSAAALGFGIFVGVAIGPGAAGTFATGQQVVELPGLVAEKESEPEAESDSFEPAGSLGGGGGSLAGGGAASSLEPLPLGAPLATESTEPLPASEETAPKSSQPQPGKEPAESGPETTELKGTVVQVNQAAASYALVIRGGELVPVHAAKLPAAGAKLSVEGLQLANGTFAEEAEPARAGKAGKATFRGVVTFVKADPLAPAYTLSGRGASLLVELPPDPSGALPMLPVRGAYGTATVALEAGGKLTQLALDVEAGEPATYLDLSGVYGGLSPETGQLLISADDTRRSGQDLSLTVPAGISLAKLTQGDSVLATANVEPDGSLTLTGIVSNERRKGADDAKSAQGDLKR